MSDTAEEEPAAAVAPNVVDCTKSYFPSDNDVNKNAQPSPDIDLLLADCQSYMIWVCNHLTMTEESMKRQVDLLQRKYIDSSEKFETDTLSANPIEHIANLGALSFYQIELNQFDEAWSTILRCRDFVLPCVKDGHLPPDYVDSFDYVWVFLRLHGSLKEWESTLQMKRFPEIDLTNIPKSFDDLRPKVKAGVFGLKQYFYKLQKVPVEQQIDLLKQAIAWDRNHYLWHLNYYLALRRKRRDSQLTSNQVRNYPWEDEIREVVLANKLTSSNNNQNKKNPICMVATIQLLAEITKSIAKEPKWKFFKFGDIKFQSMVTVKSYLQEQTSQILAMCPQSIRVSLKLADIFSNLLPTAHRNYILAKDILERIVKAHPTSAQANHRLASFFLTVELNYSQAEEFFEKAHKLDDRYYPAVSNLIHLLMRKMITRPDDVQEKIDEELTKNFWTKKDLGGLHYLKALLLCAGPKSKLTVEEFIKAYQCDEKSYNFNELPSIHKRYGWPEWPLVTRLTYDKIMSRVKKAELMEKDQERKFVLSRIYQQIYVAELSAKKSQSKWQR